MDTCKKCVGDGLIGAGEFPHQKLGRVETCDMCGGTGKTASEAPVDEAPIEVVSGVTEPVYDEKAQTETMIAVTESNDKEIGYDPANVSGNVGSVETFEVLEEKKSEDSETGSEEVSA